MRNSKATFRDAQILRKARATQRAAAKNDPAEAKRIRVAKAQMEADACQRQVTNFEWELERAEARLREAAKKLESALNDD